LQRPIIPELWQEFATPSALCEELRKVLADPQAQLRELEGLRDALGPPDALNRVARFVLERASAGE